MRSILNYTSKNKTVQNIGDYIQSIAARQFIGDNYELINREELNEYSGPKTKIILNGWFMHNPTCWPPAKNINPLFVSFHLSPAIAKKFLTAESINYLKKHEPIGCRDLQTVRTLQSHNIKAYFSSCLTTTLGKTYIRKKTNNDIYFVDPWYPQYTLRQPLEFSKSILYLMKNFYKVKKVWIKKYPNQKIKGIIKASQFYSAYEKICSDTVLQNSKYITHTPLLSKFKNENEKFEYADLLLKKYISCNFVITSRIHAALPCLGFGTPVVFIDSEHLNQEDNPERGRFEGLTNFLKTIYLSEKSFIEKNTKLSRNTINENYIFKNPELHVKYIESLEKTCKKFLKNTNNFNLDIK